MSAEQILPAHILIAIYHFYVPHPLQNYHSYFYLLFINIFSWELAQRESNDTCVRMAATAKKLVEDTKEHIDTAAASTKQAVHDAAASTKQVVQDTKQQVDATLAKIQSQTWAEPLGKACSVTGTIVKGMGNFVPGLGIVGGALSLGGTLLNPKASMNDLKRAQEKGALSVGKLHS